MFDAWGEPPKKLREESDSERQEESEAEEPETVSDSEIQDQGASDSIPVGSSQCTALCCHNSVQAFQPRFKQW